MRLRFQIWCQGISPMQTITRTTRLLFSLVLSLLAVAAMLHLLSSASRAEADHLGALAVLNRSLEPVIVKGVFPGAPTGQIFVYRAVGGGSFEQIPYQVDEVTASGAYTSAEDGLMDSNDEIGFLSGALGKAAATPITATLPISSIFYSIQVTDPLNPAQQAWAYVVRSGVLTYSNSTNYADYIAAAQQISATSYGIGWATNFVGLNYTSLFGSANILDRSKLRVLYTFLGIPSVITEESPLLLPPPVKLIRDGSVRVITSQGAATTLAYASYVQTTTPIFLPPSLTIDAVRISTDLTHTITTGTYYDENVPVGVTINGVTDTVPVTPAVNFWRQISLDSGTVIQVVDPGSTGGTLRHYYKDNSLVDANDTGDKQSFGDSGIVVISPTATALTTTSAQYFLPGRQSNRGAEFFQIFQNPLLVTVQVDGARNVYLPVILK